MGQGELQAADDTRDRLIHTARSMLLRGDNNFTVADLCGEAQVDRDQFRAYFSGKMALMAALMHEQVSQVAPALAVRDEPLPEPQTPKAEQEPSVSTPDAWLERRLRVFERALTALETKAEISAREQARVIAQLEEKIAAASLKPAERPNPEPVVAEPERSVQAEERPVSPGGEPADSPQGLRPALRAPAQAVPLPVRAAHASAAVSFAQVQMLDDAPQPPQEAQQPRDEEPQKPAPEMLAVAPLPAVSFSKEKMADVLESARARVRAATEAPDSEDKPDDGGWRTRLFVMGALSLVALFLCIGLVLGNTASAIRRGRVAEWHGEGMSHRHDAQGALAQTIASADFGDAKAEARLALAFLRGQGVARDASAALRWSHSAAEAGEPSAQYLLGALYQQGEAVKADPAKAFSWFQVAAAKGNLKAMHNLAIAYAQGLGTAKDETKAVEWFTRAAERGYVDSAFDLAVMYERGSGVPQDLIQALKWYGIAAHSGDQPSKARADFLRGQMNADDAKRAMAAATAFEPVPALPDANTL
ncbi:MAG TPA: hypothetical protein VMO78_03385 [Rhizomicrobium sp.]|nr:hypothetical protein [Rhizomicrobium sp.]